MKIVIVGVPDWGERFKARLSPGFAIVEADASDGERMARELRDAEIVISGKFTAQTAAWCRSLKLLICPWAGTEHIDRSALPAGARFVNSGGTEQAIAEHVIAVLIALRRKLFDADRNLRQGTWAYGYWGGTFVDEVYGSTLGLIGYGRIGHEVVKRAVAFGVRCRALTMHPQRAAPAEDAPCGVGPLTEPSAIDALVASCDAIVLCCELSDVTRGMIDARRLNSMKPSAVLINVARGPVAVERDLYDALKSKRIAGAALDVWWNYPKGQGERAAPSALPFDELDNVIMTPHSSGWTGPALHRRIEGIARAIESFAHDTSSLTS